MSFWHKLFGPAPDKGRWVEEWSAPSRWRKITDEGTGPWHEGTVVIETQTVTKDRRAYFETATGDREWLSLRYADHIRLKPTIYSKFVE